MNRFTCSLLIFSLIGFISADGEVKTKVSQAKSESGSSSSAASVYVPAATSGGNSGSSSDVATLLNNQAYDPTIFSTFVPQDAVQQYVSQYGTGYAGQALEGFLIPTFHERPEYSFADSPTFVSILKSFLPGHKIVLAIFAKIVALLASAVGVVFFGGAITSFICAFTPLCTITFFGRPLSILRQETKDIVEKIGEELTAERVKRAADLFRLAIDKYQAMNQKA